MDKRLSSMGNEIDDLKGEVEQLRSDIRNVWSQRVGQLQGERDYLLRALDYLLRALEQIVELTMYPDYAGGGENDSYGFSDFRDVALTAIAEFSSKGGPEGSRSPVPNLALWRLG